MKPTVAFTTVDKGGCLFYRGYIPLAYLCDTGRINSFISTTVFDYELFHGKQADRKANVCGTQRVMTDKMLGVVKRWAPLTYLDIDDNLFDLHHGNPAYYDLQELRKIYKNDPIENHKLALQTAGLVTCTTEHMAAAIRKHTGRTEGIHVIPNAFYNLYPEAEIDAQRSDCIVNRPLTIGWWGGPHHFEDFNNGLDKKLAEFINRMGERINFVCLGWAPRAMMETGRVSVVPWSPIMEFYSTLYALEIDVCIGPLVENPFSVCKSDIKWLETAMYKRCFVGSKHPVFSDVIDGETGLLTDSNDHMILTLEDLVLNPTRAREIGDNAYRYVQEYRHISKQADKWMEVFNTICESGNSWEWQMPQQDVEDYEKQIVEVMKQLRYDEILNGPPSLTKEPYNFRHVRKTK